MKSFTSPLGVVLLFLFYLSATANPISLNGKWHFKTDLYDDGEQLQWYLPEHTVDGWDQMMVPGCWDTRNEYADYVGHAWYRTTFESMEEWKGKAVRLYFEAVYNDVQVWLNGEKLGDHHIGFLPFWFDIQDQLNFDGPNVLVVQVDNTFKRGALWNWGGIRRSVMLEITEPIRIEYQHISAIPNLQDGSAEVKIDYAVRNFTNRPDRVAYEFMITKEGRRIWKSPRKEILVHANREVTEFVVTDIPKGKAELWDFNHPNLYTCELTIWKDSAPIHTVTDRFGIRKLEVVGEQLKLNGDVIRTVGFNLVPDDRTNGSSLPLWRIKQDVDMMKSLGCNMARISHTPLPDEFLDYLDEVGIMTFEEVSLWGKDIMVDPEHPLPKYWLEKMIQVKYNHPSVIGWSVGNEIGYVNVNPKVMAYVEGAIKHAKSLDPTRLAVYVSHSAHQQEVDPVQFSDLILYNTYGNWGNNVEKIHALHPGKPIFMLEYGKHLTSEDPDLANIDAAGMINQFRGKPYLAGISLWTFNDYRSFWKSIPTWTTPPSQNRTWGLVTVFRKPKKPFFTFKREYAPVKALLVTPNSENEPGKTAEMEVRITPRDILDLPAYPLRDYKIVWNVLNRRGRVEDGGVEELYEILPGSDPVVKTIKWMMPSDGGSSLKVSLLDPQTYNVLDTVIHFIPPNAPEITAVHSGSRIIRIHYKKVPSATCYKLKYVVDGVEKESKQTINEFIEVDGLEYDKEYTFSLVAINGAGESNPTETVVRTDEDELPPIIWASEPADQSFFVGYSVDDQDYIYEVEYGLSSGNYDKQIGLRNVGVLQVPGLENGKNYYYRMRSRKQWGFASEWTGEQSIKPDGGVRPHAPEVHGVIRQGKDLVVSLDPPEKITGYRVMFYSRAEQIENRFYGQGSINYLIIRNYPSKNDLSMEIRSVNENGMSDPIVIEKFVK